MAGRDLFGQTLNQGKLVIRERIGTGGYADIYRCDEPLLKREVVVKVLRETKWRSAEARERFEREAQLSSLVDHPYAAHVYACGVERPIEGDKDLAWIAMELVQGVTLKSRLKTHGPMPLEVFVPLFDRIAEAVKAVHDQGIVHRDLTASNIMVIERGGRLLARLIDFGIAKLDHEVEAAWATTETDGAMAEHLRVNADSQPPFRQGLTGRDCAMGSKHYMSPEQWRDAGSVGPATDIYALGVVIYLALTGELPFTAKDPDELYRQHCHMRVPQLRGDFPRALYSVIERALAKYPGGRYRDVSELAAALQAVLRSTERELIRCSAQQWSERQRPSGLLLGADVLADLADRIPENLSEIECSYVATSQRRARQARWLRLSAAALLVVAAVGAFLYRVVEQAHTAEQIATAAKGEQGRQELLHGESSEAVLHLEQAYQRGDHSLSVTFPLARAMQPRMAELGRLASSSGRMWSAMFSPDGKRIVTTDDKSARMWDAGSNQLLFTMSHGDIVYQALFSPDGARIITAGGDGTVRIWNVATGALIRVLTSERSGAKLHYSAVAMSSRFVAAIDMMGRAVHVWDAETGAQIAELDNGTAEVASLTFAAGGRWLATTGDDGVRVFDTSTWKRVAILAGPRVRCLSFDPTGARVAVGTYDGDVSIWKVPSGGRLRHLREAGESVDAIAFSRDGLLIAAGSRNGQEYVWDAKEGALRTELNAHHGEIYTVEFSPTANLLLSAGADGAAVISNVAAGTPVARLEGPTNLLLTAHFDPDMRRVVGASWDGTARVWDTSAPYRRWESPSIGAECDTAESLVPDQRFVALSCRNHGTHVWDTAHDQLLLELPGVTPVEGDYYSAFPALTATGDRAAIARGNTVEVYAVPSGQLLRTITHPAPVNAVAFASAGHDLVSGAIDGSLLITYGDQDPTALPKSDAGVDAVAILADGRVVVADASAHLRVIGPDRNTLMDLTVPSRVRLLRPSPDGTRLLTISIRSGQDPPALWDLTQRRLVTQLDGHVGRVFSARFVAGGHEILTAGRDGTARLWSTDTGTPVRTFRGDAHFLADATLAPDGSMVVAGGSDGLLRFWDVSSGHLLWTLQAHKSYVIGVHYEGSDIVTRSFAGDVARWTLSQPASVIDACHASNCAPTISTEK
jgi:WD40 repeat protein/serine/threonine protein kinase